MRSFFVLIALIVCPSVAWTTEYHVSPDGQDSNPGTAALPFQTIQRGADAAFAGDTITVHEGVYAESVRFTHPGTTALPIRCLAEGTVTVDATGHDWGLFVDGYEDNDAQHIILWNFRVFGATRGGIRVSWADFVRIDNCVSHDNGRWGIFTDYSNDLNLRHNTCYNSQEEHGIYVSNSGDRPFLWGNLCFNNNASGIQINADPQMEGDGITSNALIESNICYGNGAAGGAAINLASVRDSVIRNNLLYGNLAGGIAGWGDGNGPDWGCKNNVFVNNTIYFAPGTARWCISLKEGSTNCAIYNNLLFGGARGAFEFSSESESGLAMDYNILYAEDGSVVTEEDTSYFSFSEWQARGYDAHSKTAAASAVTLDPSSSDFRLRAGSPAIDSGFDDGMTVPSTDIGGRSRTDDPDTPNTGSGSGIVDMGCYEYFPGGPGPTPTPTATVPPELTIALDMGADRFGTGDPCRLDALFHYSGEPRTADFYVVLEVFGAYWFYPGWIPSWEGIDSASIELSGGPDWKVEVIPEFTMPEVSAAGPFYFYAACFAPGDLTVDALLSNVAGVEFRLQ